MDVESYVPSVVDLTEVEEEEDDDDIVVAEEVHVERPVIYLGTERTKRRR